MGAPSSARYIAQLGIGRRPVSAGRGSGKLLFDVVPGRPEQSILLHRIMSNEPGVAMPELGQNWAGRWFTTKL